MHYKNEMDLVAKHVHRGVLDVKLPKSWLFYIGQIFKSAVCVELLACGSSLPCMGQLKEDASEVVALL